MQQDPIRTKSHRAAGLAAGRFLGALAALAALGLGGCASTQPVKAFREGQLNREVRQAGFDTEELVYPFEISDEMRIWVRENVPRTALPRQRLQALLDALLTQKGLAVTYQAGYTPTAEEVFASRKANCLAFTHTFVGLAREVGLDTHYLDVLHVERYEKDNDLIIQSGHVTAGYGVPTNRLILEYNVGPDSDYTYVRQVDDKVALAMYYSNRGAELLRDGQKQRAVDALRTAVTLAPELADAWVNYGVALRRLGDESAAEEAYRQALVVDPQEVSAYQNLAALLRLQGRDQEAEELQGASERIGLRNPYSFINLGDIYLRRGLVREAEGFYRKALKAFGELADPYAALGLLAFEQDRGREARRWLERAIKRDPDNIRVRALARRLGPDSEDSEGLARLVEITEEDG